MPKKHHRTLYSKPSSSPHSSLRSVPSPSAQDGRPPKLPAATQSSVNELISHLRHTQLSSGKDHESSSRYSPLLRSERTVHPSLRNLLDIPETPQPRPRPGLRSRTRRIPGPPPPESWLEHSRYAPREVRERAIARTSDSVVIQSWAEDDIGLPGCTLPEERTLTDLVCRTMAKDWPWHQQYDGLLLSSLPLGLKEILLSYLAAAAPEASPSWRGKENTLSLLWPQEHDSESLPPGIDFDVLDDSSEVRRLDLEGALGTWITMKRLRKELLSTSKLRIDARNNFSVDNTKTAPGPLDPAVPDTWDDLDQEIDGMSKSLSKPFDIGPTLRFTNLAHLSLALSPSIESLSSVGSWAALLDLSSHLSTLKSLSLANWPLPTLTPNARASNAYMRNPVSRSLPIVRYSGSDMYTELENTWEEAANILRRLSRNLYCLQWLDLRGCGLWWGALTWPGYPEGAADSDSIGENGRHPRLSDVGPEWNGAWRGVELLGLEVGWAPHPSHKQRHCRDDEVGTKQELSPVHDRLEFWQNWDPNVEREKYRQHKERQRYMELVERAETVARDVRAFRRQKGGRWIDFRLSKREPCTTQNETS